MWDWFDSAVDTVTGIFSGAGDALGSAANWTTQNPGAANLLGGALMAGGSYLENRDTIKHEKEMQDREWARRDKFGGAIGGEATNYGVTETLATDGPLTGNGLLANMKKQQVV